MGIRGLFLSRFIVLAAAVRRSLLNRRALNVPAISSLRTCMPLCSESLPASPLPRLPLQKSSSARPLWLTSNLPHVSLPQTVRTSFFTPDHITSSLPSYAAVAVIWLSIAAGCRLGSHVSKSVSLLDGRLLTATVCASTATDRHQLNSRRANANANTFSPGETLKSPATIYTEISRPAFQS